MPTLHMSIEPTGAKNTVTKCEWTIEDLKYFPLMYSGGFDYDRIEADVHVSLDSEPSSGPIVCSIDENKKHVIFRTHREEQELDLFLRPEASLSGRVHFLKIEVADQADAPKCARIDYLDKSQQKPKWKSVKFGDDIPTQAQADQIRIVFGMSGKIGPFAYRIFVRDLQGSISGEECDPQASNEPP